MLIRNKTTNTWLAQEMADTLKITNYHTYALYQSSTSKGVQKLDNDLTLPEQSATLKGIKLVREYAILCRADFTTFVDAQKAFKDCKRIYTHSPIREIPRNPAYKLMCYALYGNKPEDFHGKIKPI